MVQLLGLHDSTAGARVLVWGTKILHAAQCGKKKEKKNDTDMFTNERVCYLGLDSQKIQEQRVGGLRMGQGW